MRIILLLLFVACCACGQELSELSIVKEGPSEVKWGSFAKYKITLTNNTKEAIADIVLRDLVPEGMEYKGRREGFALKWNVGTLAPEESRAYEYTLRALKAGTFANITKASIKDKCVCTYEFTTQIVAPGLKITSVKFRSTLQCRGGFDIRRPIIDEEETLIYSLDSAEEKSSDKK